jgi:ribosome maturation factor RimP
MADMQTVVEQTLVPMGYELIELERLGRGHVRVTIDKPDSDAGIRIEDCERVSRQLTQVLQVENMGYERLEVSSAGVDRPLKKVADYARFAGQEALVKLRAPMPGSVGGRKSYSGVLVRPEGEGNAAKLGLEFEDKDGQVKILEFVLSDVDKAHLNPTLDFKKGWK